MALVHREMVGPTFHKIYVDSDPSGGAGIAAPIGSVAYVDVGVGGWLKTGAGDTAWTRMDASVVQDYGHASPALLDLSTNPTDTNTITIEGDVYEFVDTGVNDQVAADTNIGVLKGVDAATTFASLLQAINGAATNPHPTIKQTDGVTPAVAIGTESVLGEDIDPPNKVLGLWPADAVGGNIVYGSPPDVALSDSLTAAVDWSTANLNLIPQRAAGFRNQSHVRITITAAHITAGEISVKFPFTVGAVMYTAVDSTGLPKSMGADTVLEDGTFVTVTLNGGGGDLANTNVLDILAIE